MIRTSIPAYSTRFTLLLAPHLSDLGGSPLDLSYPLNHVLGFVCPASASQMRTSPAHPDPVWHAQMDVRGAFAARPEVVHRRLRLRQILPHFLGHCAAQASHAHQ